MSTTLARSLTRPLQTLGSQMPAVIVTGPRQAGKTTLCRLAWPRHVYVNLEQPDTRRLAATDPRAFLARHRDGAILDEIQRVPELASWLQVQIDEDPRPGQWILTGSEQLTLTGRTSQSLAGRAAFAHLLPLDVRELRQGGALVAGSPGHEWTGAVLRGGYPAPLSLPVPVGTWLDGYIQSYLERDVRDLLSVGDLGRFQDFLALAAGGSGQTINFTRLGGDVGVTHPTAKSWLGVLEATFVVTRLRPWHRNLGKRLTKSPKLYFWDSGLLCHLLRIRDAEHLVPHPLRGAIFETWVVSELLKMVHHRGERPDAWFYRDLGGLEVALLLRRDDHWLAVEVKSASTVASDFTAGLRRFTEQAGGLLDGLPIRPVLVHGGEEAHSGSQVEIVPWRALPELLDGPWRS
jgi:predicted AAA+ superfamily ATPase